MHNDYSTIDAAVARLEATLPHVHGAPFWTMTRDIQCWKVTCFLPEEFAERITESTGKFGFFRVEAASVLGALNGALDRLDQVLTAAEVVAA